MAWHIETQSTGAGYLLTILGLFEKSGLHDLFRPDRVNGFFMAPARLGIIVVGGVHVAAFCACAGVRALLLSRR